MEFEETPENPYVWFRYNKEQQRFIKLEICLNCEIAFEEWSERYFYWCQDCFLKFEEAFETQERRRIPEDFDPICTCDHPLSIHKGEVCMILSCDCTMFDGSTT